MSENSISGEIRRFMAAVEAANPDMVASARISTAWHRAMDDAVLAHTDAVYSIPGTQGADVIIYTDSSIWAADLGLQAELLRLKLNVALRDMEASTNERMSSFGGAMFVEEDPETVKRLRFIVSKESYRTKNVVRSTAEQLQEQKVERVVPVALTHDEEKALRSHCSAIEDESLREAAFAAAKAGLELAKARNC